MSCTVPKYHNNCTTGRKGPLCHADDRGKVLQNRCLTERDIRCERVLAECVSACEDASEAYLSAEFARRSEYFKTTQVVWSAATTCRYRDWVDYASKEDSSDRDAVDRAGDLTNAGGTLDIGTITALEAVASRRASKCPISWGELTSLSMDNPCAAGVIMRSYIDKHDCIASCWDTAAYLCARTSECYCGNWTCGFSLPEPGGSGILPGPGQEYDPLKRGKEGTVRVTMSSYDIPIEIVYTKHFVYGNVIWMSDISSFSWVDTTKTYQDSSGVFRVETSEFYSNYVSLHLGVVAGEIDSISRIWLNEALIYDDTVSPDTIQQNNLGLTIRNGSEHQGVLEKEARSLGLGRVPAYRGIATVYVENIDLNTTGGFPELRFEVRKRSNNVFYTEPGDTVSGASVGKPIVFDTAARRILLTTDLGIEVYNLDSLRLDRVIDLSSPEDVQMFTPTPFALKRETSDYVLEDMERNVVVSRLALDTTDPALHRFIDSGNRGIYLISSHRDGTLYLTEVDDQNGVLVPWGEFPDIVYNNPMGITADIFTDRSGAEIEDITRSFFYLSTNDSMVHVYEIKNNSTDYTVTSGDTAEHSFASELMSAQIVGIVSPRDKTLVVFLTSSSEGEIIKWSPREGVIWRTKVIYPLPHLGAITCNTSSQRFAFIGYNAHVYTVRLDTGEFADGGFTLEHPPHASLSGQRYDFFAESIVYVDSSAQLRRVSSFKKNTEEETLYDAFSDVADRSGLPLHLRDFTDVSGVTITGYRSGNSLTGTEILGDLAEIYPTSFYEDSRLFAKRKSESSTVAVSTDHLRETFSYDRLEESFEYQRARIEYFSNETDGEEVSQSFSMETDIRNTETVRDLTVSTTVLENADYMRRLCELMIFSAQEDDSRSTIRIPPRYLRTTPTDLLQFIGEYRASRVTIGADLSIEVELYQDTLSKYDAILDLGVPTLPSERLSTQTPVQSLSHPIVMLRRPLSPGSRFETGVYLAASNVLGEFDSSGSSTISIISDENVPLPRDTYPLTRMLCKGVLMSISPLLTAKFTTRNEDTLTVRFSSSEEASHIVNKVFEESSTYTSEVYYNELVNVLAVGDEYIQFLASHLDSSDPSGRTVVFQGLLRSRGCTDFEVYAHEPGEAVFLYEARALYRVPAANLSSPLKFASVGNHPLTENVSRNYDIVPATQVKHELGAYNATRLDVPAHSSSSTDPTKKHIVLEIDYRYPQLRSLIEGVVDRPHVDIFELSLFAARGAWDPVRFEETREDVFDDSYVFLRNEFPMVRSLSERPGEEFFGYILSAFNQDVVNFHGGKEALTTIWIWNYEGMETFLVNTWYPSPTYERRRARGLAYPTVNIQ